MTPSQPLDIGKLKELLKRATPGPWEATERSGYREILAPDAECDWYGRKNKHAVLYCDTEIDEGEQDANAALLVAVRNSLESLIAKAERVDAMTEAMKQIASQSDEWLPIAETQARIDWIDAELEAEPRRLPYGDGAQPPCRNGYEISELIAERAGLIARNALSLKESE